MFELRVLGSVLERDGVALLLFPTLLVGRPTVRRLQCFTHRLWLAFLLEFALPRSAPTSRLHQDAALS